MFKLITTFLCIAIIPLPAFAINKEEAMACVQAGVVRFMSGQSISGMVDIPYMISNSRIPATESRVRQLLDQKAFENSNWYKDVQVNVVGIPQAKSDGFFLIAGNIWGQEKNKSEQWTKFRHHYIVWARKDGNQCRIGRLAIAEIFRLGLWVRQNT